jgi:predicted acylesterase/phospholipase RssA
MRRTRILAIDGGGIRGIIPARILQEFEAQAGMPTHQLFDVIVGTSTGGLIALGLTAPALDDVSTARYTAADLVRLYEERGSEIFSPRLWRRLLPVRKAPYQSGPLESILKEYFGDTLLSQALVEVAVTAYNIEHRRPHLFTRRRARYENAQKDRPYDFLVRDLARATTAAPTYFEPARIYPARRGSRESRGRQMGDRHTLIDGGLFANNPAFTALVEGLQATREIGSDSSIVVSLGTGSLAKSYLYEDAVGWNLLQWAPRIIDFVFDGVSDHVDDRLRLALKSDRYYRLQINLDAETDALDDASADNIARLLGKTGGLLKTKESEIASLLEELQSGVVSDNVRELKDQRERATEALAAITVNTEEALDQAFPVLTQKILEELVEISHRSSSWKDGQVVVAGSEYHDLLRNVYESARATIQATVDLEFIRTVWSPVFDERIMGAIRKSGAKVTRIYVLKNRAQLDEDVLLMMRTQQDTGTTVLAYFDDEDETFMFSPELSRAFTIVDDGEAIGVVELADREMPRARWYFGNEDRRAFFLGIFERIAQASIPLADVDKRLQTNSADNAPAQ